METTSTILTRKELYDLVWSASMVALSKKYAISDNGLRKICQRMNIPLPTNGHWMKLQFGKKVKVLALPENYSGDTTITLSLRTEDDTANSERSLLLNEIKNDTRLVLTVPYQLRYPDPLIVTAKESLTKNDSHFHEGMVFSSFDGLDIRVTPKNVKRALLFMDTLIKAIKARGGNISLRNRFTYAEVKGQSFRIVLREKTKRVMHPGKNYADYEPTNILYFKYDGYTSREWKDGTQPLENYIPAIIARLETASDELTFIQEKNQRHFAELRRKEQLIIDAAARKEKEHADFKELLTSVDRWEKAGLIRRYIDEVEVRGGATAEWLNWARKKADWYDPFVCVEDALLGKYGSKQD